MGAISYWRLFCPAGLLTCAGISWVGLISELLPLPSAAVNENWVINNLSVRYKCPKLILFTQLFCLFTHAVVFVVARCFVQIGPINSRWVRRQNETFQSAEAKYHRRCFVEQVVVPVLALSFEPDPNPRMRNVFLSAARHAKNCLTSLENWYSLGLIWSPEWLRLFIALSTAPRMSHFFANSVVKLGAEHFCRRRLTQNAFLPKFL